MERTEMRELAGQAGEDRLVDTRERATGDEEKRVLG
jgi:hypothetical protein